MKYEPEKARDEVEYKQYDKEVLAQEEFLPPELKINPDFFINNAIIKAQRCLMVDDIKSGVTKYHYLINHIEGLCRASNLLPEDYIKKIKEFKDNDTYKKLNETNRLFSVANLKMELIIGTVLGNKPITGTIRI